MLMAERTHSGSPENSESIVLLLHRSSTLLSASFCPVTLKTYWLFDLVAHGVKDNRKVSPQHE